MMLSFPASEVAGGIPAWGSPFSLQRPTTPKGVLPSSRALAADDGSVRGNPERDRDKLTEDSPVTYVASRTKPMLIIHGASAPRVIKAKSDSKRFGDRAPTSSTSLTLPVSPRLKEE